MILVDLEESSSENKLSGTSRPTRDKIRTIQGISIYIKVKITFEICVKHYPVFLLETITMSASRPSYF